MNGVRAALADPTVRAWYIAFCFALMLLPVAILTYWYHSRIRMTKGGRRLMEEQGRLDARSLRSLTHAGRLAGAIGRGAYGAAVQRQQNKTYWLLGIWLAANTVAFGILLWADEVNRGTD